MALKLSDHFSTNTLHAKQITVRGVTDCVWVRRLPAVDLRRYVAESTSDDIDVRAHAGFAQLAKAIRNEDGTAAGSVDDYKMLEGGLVKELIRVFVEVNAANIGDAGND